MKPIILGVVLLLLTGSAIADDYICRTAVEQNPGLAWRLKALNAERAAQSPPLVALTAQELVQAIFDQVLDGIQDNLEAESTRLGQEGWSILAPTDQAAICAAYTKAGKPLPVCP